METSIPLKRALTEKEAAQYVGQSHHTLRKARCEGQLPNHTPTPPFIRLGRSVRYLREDLDSFLDEQAAMTREVWQ